MAGANVENIEAAKQDDGGKRERSSIDFAYGDLDDAIEVARAIHDNAGTECETEQLAAFMGQTSTSGAFRTKVTTSGVFGVTINERGKVRLSPLGQRLLNPQQERQARAEAFLNVELYKAVYEKYKGNLLPPAVALEREMALLGVAQKQASRARQAFDRSAQQAGFYAQGRDRLVAPTIRTDMPPAKPTGEDTAGGKGEKSEDQNGGNDGGGGKLHPFIRGLLETLPQPKGDWKAEQRAEWLQAAAQVFKLIYKGDSDGTVVVSFKKGGDNGGSNGG